MVLDHRTDAEGVARLRQRGKMCVLQAAQSCPCSNPEAAIACAQQGGNSSRQRMVFRRSHGHEPGAVEAQKMVSAESDHPDVAVRCLRDRGRRTNQAVFRPPDGVAVLRNESSWIERLRTSLRERKEGSNQTQAQSTRPDKSMAASSHTAEPDITPPTPGDPSTIARCEAPSIKPLGRSSRAEGHSAALPGAPKDPSLAASRIVPRCPPSGRQPKV